MYVKASDFFERLRERLGTTTPPTGLYFSIDPGIQLRILKMYIPQDGYREWVSIVTNRYSMPNDPVSWEKDSRGMNSEVKKISFRGIDKKVCIIAERKHG